MLSNYFWKWVILDIQLYHIIATTTRQDYFYFLHDSRQNYWKLLLEIKITLQIYVIIMVLGIWSFVE